MKVDRLLEFLTDAEDDVREELVLKVAILAERWATKFDWYVDVILRLIQVAGPTVSDDIWHRVVYIVTNNERFNPGLHKYAAGKVFEAVKPESANENMVKIGAVTPSPPPLASSSRRASPLSFVAVPTVVFVGGSRRCC